MDNPYRFQDSKGEHSHQINIDGEWKNLTGTTEVLSIVAKPLTWWAVGEGLKILGWTPITETKGSKRVNAPYEPRLESATLALEHIRELDGEGYLEELDQAYYAHSKVKNKAAGDGKELHSRLEKYVKTCIDKHSGVPVSGKSDLIQKFIDWSVENVDQFIFSEGHTYSEKYWIGGIVDCGAKLKDGRMAIIDFKSSKAAYNSQFWQIGAYEIQISEKGIFSSDGDKIMEPTDGFTTHIVIPFGAPEFSPVIVNDEKGIHKQAYLAALTLYRIDQRT